MHPQPQLSILLVEDDESACELISSMLAIKFPHALIYKAADGKAGLDSFLMYQPDIVITDINMPEMDGVQMLTRISATKPDLHVIVVTAHSDRHNLGKISSAGAHVEFVLKPVDFEILFVSIKRLIASAGTSIISSSH